MSSSIDIRTAEFLVEIKSGQASFRLAWPDDKYYDLVRSPVQVLQMDASELTKLARWDAADFPDVRRLQFQMTWFTSASAGARVDWPALPVLARKGAGLTFVDGRHRCEALEILGALRIPVIVG